MLSIYWFMVFRGEFPRGLCNSMIPSSLRSGVALHEKHICQLKHNDLNAALPQISKLIIHCEGFQIIFAHLGVSAGR